MAPLWRIQWSAALVSSPPEKAMPTFSPTGTVCRMLAKGAPRESGPRSYPAGGGCARPGLPSGGRWSDNRDASSARAGRDRSHSSFGVRIARSCAMPSELAAPVDPAVHPEVERFRREFDFTWVPDGVEFQIEPRRIRG